MVSFIVYIVVGAFAGWLGDKLLGGGDKGFFLNMIIGIIGGCLGGALLGDLFSTLPSFGPISLGGLITATLGSAFFLWLISLLKKK